MEARGFVEDVRNKDSGIVVSPMIDYHRTDTYLTEQKIFDNFLDNILIQATLP